MDTKELLDALAPVRVLPLLSGEDPERVSAAAEVLAREGFPVLEVALRTPRAMEALDLISRRLPEVILGAGTLLDPSQAGEARRAGARFAVSPGFRPILLEAAREAGLAFVPGVATPSEAMAALEEGLTLLKFFPARALGGPARLEATHAALGHKGLAWIPTGGIDENNLAHYLAHPWVAACGGSWTAPKALVREGRRKELQERARSTLALVQGLSKPRRNAP